MVKNITLILGADLIDSGLSLGPKTVSRLQRALKHHEETGNTLIVAAGYSPYFPDQVSSMANMMKEFLRLNGCDDVVVLKASTFDTEGELFAFYDYQTNGKRSILSAQYHIKRTRLLIRHLFGLEVLQHTTFIPDARDRPSIKEYVLEPLKWIYIISPKWVKLLTISTIKKSGINISW